MIVVGGSYAGLSAALALGRALRKVLVIDSGLPANRQTPFAHNILTRDGTPPAELSAIAKKQVAHYQTVEFANGFAEKVFQLDNSFEVVLQSGISYFGCKLVFATGIKDLLPAIPGFAECWGISVIHCPYCHGYEVRNSKTGIMGNGDAGFEFAKLIANWTSDLTLFTNGPSTLTYLQKQQLAKHAIPVVETVIESIEHINGYLTYLQLKDGCMFHMDALYAPVPFEQHSSIPVSLGCELTEEGYIEITKEFETTVSGVYAVGDNTTKWRTVAGAFSMGTAVGMSLSRKMIMDKF